MTSPLPDRLNVSRADLVPFLPRLTLEWLRDDPERRFRELDGTLAFVDISGFTALSERLAGLGKAGAEALTDVIDSTFASLLEVAYACGGGLLKFGGDALLLLFSGDGHAPRAARAAFEMNQLLKRIGRVRTDAGTATLRMHVGIHSGSLHFFLVGDMHRELLVTGPAATATVNMEAGSEAGEILVSHHTAAAVEPACLGSVQGPGVLLHAAPDVDGRLEPLPDPADAPLEDGVPVALRAQLLEVGPLEGEHRPAAVAFIRYQDVDALIERVGPEGAVDALDELVRVAEHAAAEHGVTFLQSDIDSDGGKIILVSGVPQTQGDNEERMLRTVRAIVDAGLPLPLHVGVSRGRIFAGQVGFQYRRTYTVMGDTVALAARLMSRARAGEIIVAADAFERSNGRFAGDELEPFEVKGMSVPIHAVALGSFRDAQTRTKSTSLPFVDRDEERASLAMSAETVRLGNGQLVELVGDPGIGKSRLADELRRQCGDMVVLAVRCEQYESSTPYHVFRPLLRSLLSVEAGGDRRHNLLLLSDRIGRFDPKLVPWVPLLAAPLDVEVEATKEVADLDPEFRRPRLHELVGALLGHLLDGPTLLMFDDAQWMDEASSELLHYLGGRLSQRPWLVCTMRRPVGGGFVADAGGRPAPVTLRLGPLPAPDAETLVRAASGERRLSSEATRAIAERAAGNPFFLEELAGTEGAADELPETVEALLATRIDRLAPGDRTALRWASVLGIAFSGQLVTDVLSDHRSAGLDFESRLQEFVEREPGAPDHIRFRHALVRDVAYEGLSYRRRRELHGLAADAIERQHATDPNEAAELLSLHYHRARRWPETWRYSVAAGRRAEEKYANVETAQFLERALEAAKSWPDAPAAEVARVWELLGDVRMRIAAYEEAGAAYRQARTFWRGQPVQVARLMQQEALVPLRTGRYPQALRRLTQAIRVLEGVEGPEACAQRARLYGWYGSVNQNQWRPARAVEWCLRAIAEAERCPPGVTLAEVALAQAYFTLDWGHLALGRADEAVNSPRAVEIYERLGNLDRLGPSLNIMGARAYLTSRWGEACDLFDQARQTLLKLGDEMNASTAAVNLGIVLSDQGRLDEAEPHLRGALERRRASGVAVWIGDGANELGRFAARTGRFDEARELLAEARKIFVAEEDEVEALTSDVWLAECRVLEGASGAALELTSRALEQAATIDGVSVLEAMLHRLRGWALLQTGDVVAARASFDTSLEIARLEGGNLGMRNVDYEIALALDALVQLRELAGEPAEELEHERDTILAKLDVRDVRRPPLPR
jgi:class 3 adenylate cyclase/tetratricopeptide (TPR) repeat protein